MYYCVSSEVLLLKCPTLILHRPNMCSHCESFIGCQTGKYPIVALSVYPSFPNPIEKMLPILRSGALKKSSGLLLCTYKQPLLINKTNTRNFYIKEAPPKRHWSKTEIDEAVLGNNPSI